MLGLAGVSYSPVRELRLDFDLRRSAIDYTPRSARFGVMRNRAAFGMNFFFDPRTRLSVDYGYENYNGLGPGTLQAHTGDIRFMRNLYESDQAAAEFHARLAPRLDFDIAGGIGVRQRPTTDSFGREVKPIRRGGSVKPSFTIRVSKRLAVTLRYTFYTTAQLLDTFAAPGARDELQGNIFSITTDWKF
jgi:hypothetical protein